MIDAAKTIMEGVREKNGTDSVFYDKSGEVLKRADQKVRNIFFTANSTIEIHKYEEKCNGSLI